MTTGVKIAIGCGVALILGIIVVAVGIGVAAYWAKGKVEEVTGNENRIQELHKKANATPFERPDDGIIREDRLLKFLDVRQRVFGVYEKHRAALDAMSKKTQGDWGDVTTGFSVVNEIRTAQAQALADIREIITRINDAQHIIAAAVEEQTVTTAVIGQSVSDSASLTEQISHNAETVSQAAEHTNAGALDTQQAAGELSAMAAQLHDLVGMFTY